MRSTETLSRLLLQALRDRPEDVLRFAHDLKVPLDHNPLHRYTRCTVFPPSREPGPDGRCVEGCESTERAIRRTNPKLWFDLADSAMTTCYHCGQAVYVSCQHVPVDTVLAICDQYYKSVVDDDCSPSQIPALPTCASTNAAMNPASVPEHEPAALRANEKWSESEYGHLIEMLRDGLLLEDIAAQLGRGVDAVASRWQRLLPPSGRVPRGEADLVLRAYLTGDPDYDWRAVLREEANRRGRFYWAPLPTPSCGTDGRRPCRRGGMGAGRRRIACHRARQSPGPGRHAEGLPTRLLARPSRGRSAGSRSATKRPPRPGREP